MSLDEMIANAEEIQKKQTVGENNPPDDEVPELILEKKNDTIQQDR